MESSKKRSRWVQWDIGKILGRGQFGTVSLGSLNDESSKTPVAVKSAASGTRGEIQLRREKEFLDKLHCPQVIRCHGDSTTIEEKEDKGKSGEGAGAGAGERQTTYNVFLEFAPDGSLRDRLQKQPMQEPAARRLTRSMLQGLAHIHRHGVAHCDVKPDNVMLWGKDEVKFIDFGLALRSSESVEGTLYRGTPNYLAPECIAREEYKAPADVWALGCTLSEMLTGKPARAHLEHVADPEFLDMIGRGDATPKIPEHMSESGRRFLSRCFEVDPRKRSTAEMLLRDPYIAEGDEHTKGSSSSSSSSVPKLRRWRPHEMLIAQ